MDQAEKLRNIIKNQSGSQNSLARVITITSGKGGVGKTSTAVNLALQLSKLGNKVIIIDADFGLANIEVMLGIRPEYTLADVMLRGKSIKEAITTGPGNVGFLSGGSGIKELANMDKEQVLSFIKKLSELDNMADIIIIDTGAGISQSVLEFVVASPEVLLVTTPEPTSITDSYALIKALAMHRDFDRNATKIMVISNRVSSVNESRGIFEKLSVVVEKFLNIKLHYIGAVPFDSTITKAVMKQKPVSIAYPSAASAKAFERICGRMVKGETDVPHQKKGVSRFFGRVFGMR